MQLKEELRAAFYILMEGPIRVQFLLFQASSQVTHLDYQSPMKKTKWW